MQTNLRLLAFFAVISLASCSTMPSARRSQPLASVRSPRQRVLLDADWTFHRGDITPAANVIKDVGDDAGWQYVDLPHDYILGGKYDSKLDRNHGYLPLDVGWYRKRIVIPESDKGKILRLDFDGVYRDAEVWFNGQSLGRHRSGYTPFSLDITKLGKIGEENVVAVRVDPREFEGWWYEGGGIYRHVWLTALDPVHVAQYGTYVVSEVPGGNDGKADEADLTIQTTVENNSASTANFTVASEIIAPDGHAVAKMTSGASASANAKETATQKLKFNRPALWSVKHPNLYHLRTTISQNGRVTDGTVTPFGIRTLRFDKDKGFFLNGEHVEIHGVCCHQDLAGVGVAVPDSLQPWRVARMKKAGANGWRTAHNPPAEATLDACDEQGLLVMDENRHLGDTYKAKTPPGTGDSDLADLATMIQRDRNHPSVIMWSMCNEEDIQGTPEAAKIFSAMMKETQKYDQSRPITSAMNGREGVSIFLGHGIADVEQILGVNYNYAALAKIRARHPDLFMFGSEDGNEKTTRGEYANDKTTGMVSCYNLSEKTWGAMIRPPMNGGYVWTGFDYRGEPNPFGWPDVSNNTGLVDLAGFPKDKFYYFKSCWTTEPMVHLLPDTWNWPGKEGKNIRVIAFANTPRVELFLNGKSLGFKDMKPATHVEWQVPYTAGSLVAKAIKDGKVVAQDEVQTTGSATRILLHTDRTSLHADAEDAVVARVTIVDDKGRIVQEANNHISFKIEGDGQILGVGNGNPADHDSEKSSELKAFHAHGMAVIQAGSKKGKIHLTASSPGLATGEVTFEVR